MNFKQKLTYMLIGSLFTLAGYFFASLGGSALQTTHAQQNEKEVIDEIVCRKIKIVNETGKLRAVVGYNDNGGLVVISNNEGRRVVDLSVTQGSTHLGIVGGEGEVSIYRNAGDPRVKPIRTVSLGTDSYGNGTVEVYNKAGLFSGVMGGIASPKDGRFGVAVYHRDVENLQLSEVAGMFAGENGGFVKIANNAGKRVVTMGGGESGYIEVYSKKGKDLVSISAQEGRPNDGLINVYNHKGEWRSISKD